MLSLQPQTNRTQGTGVSPQKSFEVAAALSLVMLFVGCGPLLSQQLRLNLYRTHVSDIAFTTNYLSSTPDPKVVSEGSQTGAGVEMVFNNVGSLELMYLYQGHMRPSEESHESNKPVLPLAVNYLLLSAGGHVENALGEIQGYGAIVGGLSFARFPETGGTPGQLAWGGRMGCTWWVGKIVGLKLETLFLFSPSPDYSSTAIAPASPYSQTSVHQLSFAGGLMFKICGN